MLLALLPFIKLKYIGYVQFAQHSTRDHFFVVSADSLDGDWLPDVWKNLTNADNYLTLKQHGGPGPDSEHACVLKDKRALN